MSVSSHESNDEEEGMTSSTLRPDSHAPDGNTSRSEDDVDTEPDTTMRLRRHTMVTRGDSEHGSDNLSETFGKEALTQEEDGPLQLSAEEQEFIQRMRYERQSTLRQSRGQPGNSVIEPTPPQRAEQVSSMPSRVVLPADGGFTTKNVNFAKRAENETFCHNVRVYELTAGPNTFQFTTFTRSSRQLLSMHYQRAFQEHVEAGETFLGHFDSTKQILEWIQTLIQDDLEEDGDDPIQHVLHLLDKGVRFHAFDTAALFYDTAAIYDAWGKCSKNEQSQYDEQLDRRSIG